MENSLKLLVVDDSRISRKWLIEMLPDFVQKRSTIIEGTNGQEGVDLYQEHSPDLVFLDITMPIMNGFEAAEKIIENDANATIIIVSADRQKLTKEKLMGTGVKAVLNKPVDTDEFRDLLLGLL